MKVTKECNGVITKYFHCHDEIAKRSVEAVYLHTSIYSYKSSCVKIENVICDAVSC